MTNGRSRRCIMMYLVPSDALSTIESRWQSTTVLLSSPPISIETKLANKSLTASIRMSGRVFARMWLSKQVETFIRPHRIKFGSDRQKLKPRSIYRAICRSWLANLRPCTPTGRKRSDTCLFFVPITVSTISVEFVGVSGRRIASKVDRGQSRKGSWAPLSLSMEVFTIPLWRADDHESITIRSYT